MDISDIMDELAESLASIDGLRVTPYYLNSISPPAVVVSWPEPYTFDATYGRGMDDLTFPITVFVGKVDARSAKPQLAQYAKGSGDSSIKQAIEAFDYTSCDSVRVQSVEFGVITVAGVDYLAGTFHVNVVGSGS